MIRALLQDARALGWLVVIGAAGTSLFLGLRPLLGPPWLAYSLGLPLALLATKLLTLGLCAVAERVALRRGSSRPGVLRGRFHGFGAELLVLPSIRALYRRLAGARPWPPDVLLVGDVRIDFTALVTIGPRTVIEAATHLACGGAPAGEPQPISIGSGCTIHGLVTIGAGTRIGDGVEIGTKSVIGRGCEIGDGAVLLPRSVVPDGAVVPVRP